jgi:murein DD-endopeptidase / murein LD-carboxypeptidase
MRPDLAARALVGVRFRPQGRVSELGLDCVGLVLRAFGLPDDMVRRDYRIRGDHRREMLAALAMPFRRIARTRRRCGDVLVLNVAKDQFHLAILTDAGFVHADARRGKVVETPGRPPWPVVAVFRRRARRQGQI